MQKGISTGKRGKLLIIKDGIRRHLYKWGIPPQRGSLQKIIRLLFPLQSLYACPLTRFEGSRFNRDMKNAKDFMLIVRTNASNKRFKPHHFFQSDKLNIFHITKELTNFIIYTSIKKNINRFEMSLPLYKHYYTTLLFDKNLYPNVPYLLLPNQINRLSYFDSCKVKHYFYKNIPLVIYLL